MCIVKRQEQENNAFVVLDAHPPPNTCHCQDLEDMNLDGVELQAGLPWWALGTEAGGGRPRI